MLPIWPRFFYTRVFLFSISILFVEVVSCIHPSGLLSDFLSSDLATDTCSMEWILNCYFNLL